MSESAGEALLGLDCRPIFTVWQQHCDHGDLFIVQAEGGDLTSTSLATGADYLQRVLPQSAGFVLMYDLSAGMNGFIQHGASLLEFVLRIRVACPGKQRAVIIASSNETQRAWVRWFVNTIQRDAIPVFVVATVEEAWAILDAPDLNVVTASGMDGGDSLQGWEELLPLL